MSRPPAVDDPALFLDRELSLLAFHRRVLEQAADEDTPLLERLCFLGISSTNVDEFFEIRVSGLKEQISLGLAHHAPHGMDAAEVLAKVAESAHALVDDQYRLLHETLLPALAAEDIHLLRTATGSVAVERWLKRYFRGKLLPVLTPIGLDPAHPFPRILNKSQNFLVTLEGRDAFGRKSRMAVVQAPRALARLVHVPPRVAGHPHQFVLLTTVIRAHVEQLFPGMQVLGCHAFRVTRNSDLWVDEEEVDDLLHALAGELPRRDYGHAVRLEVDAESPEQVVRFLQDRFELGPDDVYRVAGPVNLARLAALADIVKRPDLRYRPFTPPRPAELTRGTDLFERMREKSHLLHHPFESFDPVVELLEQAAADPKVMAIKMTLYRTGAGSPVVEALIEAARAGKEVTAVVELRARFDEAANIELASKLQEAGAHVVYGIVGYKTHCKMILVVRREHGRMRRYVHLGTGNYHPKTARAYTDYGLFSANEDLGHDVQEVFMQLTSLMKTEPLKLLSQSPFNLHERFLGLIRRETRNAENGGTGHIIAKLNALVEPSLIAALYEASNAGVFVDLIVRGICCLRPGIPGVSENIRVRSIVGRFLEHTRCYYFHNGGNEEVFCASADWMDRNMFRRIEVMFPVLEEPLKRRLIGDLDIYLADNTQAWELQANGRYSPLTANGREPFSAQARLLSQLAESS